MTIQEILAKGGDVEKYAKAFISSSAAFIDVLAKNNLSIDLGVADTSSVTIDYDAPASASYKKTYRPLNSSEIIQANKEMAEALAGEHWVDGFMTCVQLVMMFAKA